MSKIVSKLFCSNVYDIFDLRQFDFSGVYIIKKKNIWIWSGKINFTLSINSTN